ncbi:NfeD family protein [Taklimakanibacter deserti]|uniref:NfeD family protein n=1 Tax=Taklimakanibacter deserti TaxID=2267839 RepID=UPI000E65E821
MKLVRLALLAAVLAVAAGALLSPATAETGAPKVALLIEIDGAIGPATARLVKDGLASATERRAEVVILRLNTPGGLATSMREIIADVLASPVPVVGYVAPSGGHAASAGTYILYATHVAAMAPGTNLGAATPVEIGAPFPGLPSGEDGNKDTTGKDEKNPAPSAPPKDAMSAKATNDAVALIRSLAELHGRNADWGEKAVREAASLSANAALDQRVIDLVVPDINGLLQSIDGRKVEIAGSPRSLQTKGLPVETFEPGWLIRLLAVITDPNIAILLMIVGVYGIIFEFMSPGAVAPGVIGTISLLLGLYALNLLPIDYTGLALMLLGIGFLIVEAFNPTVVLGVGGLAAFLLGAAMLFRVQAPGYQLSWTIMAVAAALMAGLFVLTGRYLWSARKNPVRVGAQAMRGSSAEILDWSEHSGHVLAQGERWRAQSDEMLRAGDEVEIADVKDLTLTVRRRRTSLGEPP